MKDLAFIQAARSAGEAARICSELFYGFAQPDDAAITEFNTLRSDVEILMSGVGQARDRASESLTQMMIPEALDYPL